LHRLIKIVQKLTVPIYARLCSFCFKKPASESFPPVHPSGGHGHEVADVGHEDEEQGDADERVADAEHLAGGRLWEDVTVTLENKLAGK
jgi:hypothetical protein